MLRAGDVCKRVERAGADMNLGSGDRGFVIDLTGVIKRSGADDAGLDCTRGDPNATCLGLRTLLLSSPHAGIDGTSDGRGLRSGV